jgi:flagellum-specific ATP synthase
MRRQAAYVTLTLAEYFRDLGKEVLCIIDSMTRFAMAQREIGLMVGEPPTTRGYTPSVFSELPKLLERAGPGTRGTHITAFFNVLVEGDDHNEPITDAVRGILDGHIVLDRAMAERSRFPSINVTRSISRSMPACNSKEENDIVQRVRSLISLYDDMVDMIKIGAYQVGSNQEVDKAIRFFPKIEAFLSQTPDEITSMADGYVMLGKILAEVDQ